MPIEARYGIVLDSSGAVRATNDFTASLERADSAVKRATATTKEQEYELRKLAEISRSVDDYYGKQFQSLIRLNGGQEKFLQVQKQIDQELLAAERLLRSQTVAVEASTVALNNSGVGANRFRSALSTLAAQSVGTSSSVGQLGGLLGSFAIGTAETAGILAGIAAIAFAFDKIGDHAKEQTKAIDDLIAKLDQARKADFERSTAGLATAANAAAFEEDQARAAFIKAQAGSVRATPNGQTYRVVDQDAVRDAADKLREAKERNAYASQQYEEAVLGADLKRLKTQDDIDARKQKSADKEQAALAKYWDEWDKRQAQAEKEQAAAYDKLVKDYVDALGQADKEKRQLYDFIPTAAEARDSVKNDIRRSTGNLVDENLLKKLNNNFGDLSDGAAKAARTISQAVEYLAVSRIGGGGVGASIGGAIAKGVLDDNAGGFAKTATGSAIFGPIAAGVGAFVGGLLDSAAAAKAHEKAFAAASRQLKEDVEDFHARATGTQGTLDQQERQAHRDADKLRLEAKEIYDSPAGREFLPGRYAEELKKIAADEEAYIKLLREEAAVKKQRASEDLEVRALRASGKDKEADALDLDLRQRREYEQAVKDGMSAEYLARLKEVQAIEKTKAAFDELTHSTVNLVDGYKYQATVFKYASPRGTTPFDAGIVPVIPKPLPAPSGTSNAQYGVADVYMDGTKVGQIVLKTFQKQSNKVNGESSRWNEVQYIS